MKAKTPEDEAEQEYIQEKFDQMRKTNRIGPLLSNTGLEYKGREVTTEKSGDAGGNPGT